MLDGLIHKAQASASETAQMAALGLGASIAFGVGLAFLTLSAWLALNTVTTPTLAALIIGGVYSGGALLVFAVMAGISRSRKRNKQHAAAVAASSAAASSGLPGVVAAFMAGMTAGANTRS